MRNCQRWASLFFYIPLIRYWLFQNGSLSLSSILLLAHGNKNNGKNNTLCAVVKSFLPRSLEQALLLCYTEKRKIKRKGKGGKPLSVCEVRVEVFPLAKQSNYTEDGV
jgi:hypothetical protein